VDAERGERAWEQVRFLEAMDRINSVVMVHADLLKEKHSPEADAITRAVERAASLTRQLLTFSRGVVRQPRLANLNETVEESLRFLRRVIGEQIELVFEPSDEVWRVRVDPVQMQ